MKPTLSLCGCCYSGVHPKAMLCPACAAERVAYHRVRDQLPWVLLGIFAGVLLNGAWLEPNNSWEAWLVALYVGGLVGALAGKLWGQQQTGWRRSQPSLNIRARYAPPPR